MPTYRLVGTQLMLPRNGRLQTLRAFGSPIELDESEAQTQWQSNAGLLTDEQYQSLGVSDDQEKRYASYMSWKNAPAEFQTKLAKAHELVRQNIDKAKNPTEVKDHA